MSTSRLAIEYLPLEALRPYERNARTHSAAQIGQIAASMKAFGWTNPILVDEADGIIAGHGRLLAAREIGEAQAPVIRIAGLSDEQRRALVIADNKLALNAGWDETLLAAELQTLGDLQHLVGFSDEELLRLLNGGNAGLTDPDEVPDAPAEPITQPGDLWRLGPHRLVCGDATNADDVARALGGVQPHLMVTDPPYGVDYDPRWRAELGIDWMGQAQRLSTHPLAKPLGEPRGHGKVSNDHKADWTEAWKLFPGTVAYVWHGGLHADVVAQSLQIGGFLIRAQIIWVKSHFVFSRGDYHWQHESCWYVVKKGMAGAFTGDRKQTTVWQIPNASAFNGKKDDADTGHGTQKPVECMRRPIENNSSPGQVVYEPFCGSGTTIIAAEMTGRVCHALEIEPAYCDVAVERWQNFTGRKAERIAHAVAA